MARHLPFNVWGILPLLAYAVTLLVGAVDAHPVAGTSQDAFDTYPPDASASILWSSDAEPSDAWPEGQDPPAVRAMALLFVLLGIVLRLRRA